MTEATEKSDDLLTVEEAAAAIQMHRETIRRYIKAGTISAQRFGPRVWRIRRGDLEAMRPAKAPARCPVCDGEGLIIDGVCRGCGEGGERAGRTERITEARRLAEHIAAESTIAVGDTPHTHELHQLAELLREIEGEI